MAHQRAHRVLLAMPVAAPAPALRRGEFQDAPRTLPCPAQDVEEEGHFLRGLVRIGMARGDDQDGALGRLREAGDDEAAR